MQRSYKLRMYSHSDVNVIVQFCAQAAVANVHDKIDFEILRATLDILMWDCD